MKIIIIFTAVAAVMDISMAQWETCASEWKTCECEGVVRYGKNDVWSKPRAVSGEVQCTNAVFGDPIHGVFKECQCAPAANCSTITTEDECLAAVEGRGHWRGSECSWCCGGECDSIYSGSFGYPAKVQCEALALLRNRSRQPHKTTIDNSCPAPEEVDCRSLTNEDDCVAAVEARPHWRGSQCSWCCGEDCESVYSHTANYPASKCEATALLKNRVNQPHKSFSQDTCPITKNCSEITTEDECLEAVEQRGHWAGSECSWCCGGECESIYSGSFGYPAKVQCEARALLVNRVNQPHKTKSEDACPARDEKNCSLITDEDECLAAVEGRGHWKGSPCSWCCGEQCNSIYSTDANYPADLKCEASALLKNRMHQPHKSFSEDRCPVMENCSTITTEEECLAAVEKRSHWKGSQCSWCCGGECDSIYGGSENYPAVVRCEAKALLSNRVNQPHKTESDDTCPARVEADCHSIKTREDCINAVEGRDHWKGSQCSWCCGGECDSIYSNDLSYAIGGEIKCEATALLRNRVNQPHQNSGYSTCPIAKRNCSEIQTEEECIAAVENRPHWAGSECAWCCGSECNSIYSNDSNYFKCENTQLLRNRVHQLFKTSGLDKCSKEGLPAPLGF